jgi:hypothetical protein
LDFISRDNAQSSKSEHTAASVIFVLGFYGGFGDVSASVNLDDCRKLSAPADFIGRSVASHST